MVERNSLLSKFDRSKSIKTYGLLSILACVITLLIGMHGSWRWAITGLLVMVGLYALGRLIFRQSKPAPLSFDLIPGDPDNLDKLYARAIQYCNDIIAYYQRSRYNTRRYYIVAQLLTAALSGLTPILVLIEQSDPLKTTLPDSLQVVLTWAMIVVPGIAAILATTSTIFNFQEEWIQAKKTAEALEAVREEFMIGASPQYRITAQDPAEKLLQRKQSLENFIIKVNELHLNQVDRWASLQRSDQQQPLGSANSRSSRPDPVSVSSPPPSSAIALPNGRPIPDSLTTSFQTRTNFDSATLSQDNLRQRPDLDFDLMFPRSPDLSDADSMEPGSSVKPTPDEEDHDDPVYLI